MLHGYERMEIGHETDGTAGGNRLLEDRGSQSWILKAEMGPQVDKSRQSALQVGQRCVTQPQATNANLLTPLDLFLSVSKPKALHSSLSCEGTS